MIGEKVLVQLYFCSIFLFNSCCSEVDVQATDHCLDIRPDVLLETWSINAVCFSVSLDSLWLGFIATWLKSHEPSSARGPSTRLLRSSLV